jgi:hypothetical protein
MAKKPNVKVVGVVRQVVALIIDDLRDMLYAIVLDRSVRSA